MQVTASLDVLSKAETVWAQPSTQQGQHSCGWGNNLNLGPKLPPLPGLEGSQLGWLWEVC